MGKEAFEAPARLTKILWKDLFYFLEPSKKSVSSAADMGLHKLTDGGNTDPFGISTAVAAGATDIFTVNTVSEFIILPSTTQTGGIGVNIHFAGYNFDDTSSIPRNIASIFKEDQEYFATMNMTERQLHVADRRLLQELSYVTMKVTTVQNDYFGIKAGRTVNLHVVRPKGNISIGTSQKFSQYGDYVQEIVNTLADDRNEFIVKEMLDALTLARKKKVGNGSSGSNPTDKRTYADVVKGEL